MVDENTPSSKELLFLHIVSMFQGAAMQQMGKIMDPLTGKVEKDLEHAKVSIDILDVLKEKTQGNLSKPEEEFLSKVLFELHMNYVDELETSQQADTDESATKSDEEQAEAATPGETEADSRSAEDETARTKKDKGNDG
jgi:hypothetical protein